MEERALNATDAPPKKKQTKSDLIAHATLQDYMHAHSKPNGGFRAFMHSNLFAALMVWVLSQAVIFGGFIISFYMKSTQLTEWKGNIDATIRRMDDLGTIHGKFADESQDKTLAAMEPRLKKVEDDTRHLEVIESEHRRLTKDVEELRNGKK